MARVDDNCMDAVHERCEGRDCACSCHTESGYRDLFGDDTRADLEHKVAEKAIAFQRRLGYRYVAELDLEFARSIDALREFNRD